MNAPRPAPAEASLAAIVVAADSGQVLAQCVAALLGCDACTSVTLADNASRDGVPQRVAAAHAGDARLRVQRNARNLGFGAAVNRVAAGLDADWLAIINPDCVVPPLALAQLLRAARETLRAGLLGAVICAADGSVDPATRRRDPLLRRSLVALGLARGEGVAVAGPIVPAVQDVEAISGAFMLVSRALFEQLGGFDEGYFLHCEDLDLCRRVRDAGYRVLLAGNVRLVHGKGSSSRHRPRFVAWHKHRGMWRWFRKFDPAARNPLTAAAAWCGLWAHFALTCVRPHR